MLPFASLDALEAKGKRIALRIDINSPVEGGRVIFNERFLAHAATIKELIAKGAAVVLLAHQGRVGDEDFVSLQQHAELLSKCLKRRVKFVGDTIGPSALKAIASLKPGKILLLENLRFLAEETLERSAQEHAKSIVVQRLAPLFDAFVNDAYSACHRAHASIVGFAVALPSYAGRLLEREWINNSRLLSDVKRPCIYVMGGTKVEELLLILEHSLPNRLVDKVLCGGAFGELCLRLLGTDLGAKNNWLEKKYEGVRERISALLSSYRDAFLLPIDVACESNGTRVEISLGDLAKEGKNCFDIGAATCGTFGKAIASAGTILLKGPTGAYEKEVFREGTRRILAAIARATKRGAFSIIAGGDSCAALGALGFKPRQFSHTTTAGGAFLTHIATGKLVGVEALVKKS